jgi:hypothetical protein
MKTKRSTRLIAWVVCFTLPIAALGWFGHSFLETWRGHAQKTSGHLQDAIEQKLGLINIKSIPNRPKYGDITLQGKVAKESDKVALEKLAREWTDASCKVHVDVKINTRNKASSTIR